MKHPSSTNNEIDTINKIVEKLDLKVMNISLIESIDTNSKLFSTLLLAFQSQKEILRKRKPIILARTQKNILDSVFWILLS